MKSLFILFAHLSAMIFMSQACKYIKVESPVLGGTFDFYQDAYDAKYHKASTRRPKYHTKSNSGTEFALKHQQYDDLSGIGVWEIHQGEEIVARVESWAVTPYLVDAVADNDSSAAIWRVRDPTSDNNELTPDLSFSVQCVEPAADDVLIFIPPPVMSDNRLDIHGFYIKQILAPPANTSLHEPVYAKVSIFTSDKPLFLFRIQFSSTSSNWMIGEEYGKDDGMAYISSTSLTVNSSLKGTWHYIQNSEWTPDHQQQTKIISLPHPFVNETIYDLLRTHRTLNSLPKIGQSIFKLRSGQFIPSVGLGTGGIPHHQCYTTFYDAIDLGYRMFDLAREYNNEQYMGEVLRDIQSSEGALVDRSDLYLISKVWPTNLGFEPTLHEIIASLSEMEINYLDMFLLHWPACDESIDWMHCDTVVDPTATWHESWRAMEKAVAEGIVSSIGVSNFDIKLLQELRAMAVIQPELVQNYGALGSLDLEVRRFCHRHGIAYQPYATVRNLLARSSREDETPRATARAIATKRNISQHRVSLQFFLQTNALIIPRATQYHHLEENIALAYQHVEKRFPEQEYKQQLLSDEEMAALGWITLNDSFTVKSGSMIDEEL
jgi:diketogulonate reductase-like aldo/keto reductase